MKKFVALLLAMLLVLANVAALADPENPDAGSVPNDTPTAVTIYYKKTYNTNASGILPSETLAFSVGDFPNYANPDSTVKPTVASFNVDNYTVPTGTENTNIITVTMPTYTKVGLYKYLISETPGTSQGATYDTNKLALTVLVDYDDHRNIRVRPVVTEGVDKDGEKLATKVDTFSNDYQVGNLTVNKTVSGNLASQDQYFEVTVTLTPSSGKTVNNVITYTGGTDTTATNKTIAKGWSDSKEIQLKIKHGETITFSNIPADVTYKVVEASKHADTTDTTMSDPAKGYTITYKKDNAIVETLTGSIEANETADAKIENKKETTVPTGINLDSIPYLMILAIAMLGVVAINARKREEL